MKLIALLAILGSLVMPAVVSAEDAADPLAYIPFPTPSAPVHRLKHVSGDHYSHTIYFNLHCDKKTSIYEDIYYSGVYITRWKVDKDGVCEIYWSELTDTSGVSYSNMNPKKIKITFDDFISYNKSGKFTDATGNPIVKTFVLPKTYAADMESCDIECSWAQRTIVKAPPRELTMEERLETAVVESWSRVPFYEFALKSGMATSGKSTYTLNNLVSETQYSFNVASAKCTPVKPDVSQCSYKLRISQQSTAFGMAGPNIQSDWIGRNDSFRIVNGKLISQTLDAAFYDVAVAQDAKAAANMDKVDQRERDRKHTECLDQALNERRMAFCVY